MNLNIFFHYFRLSDIFLHVWCPFMLAYDAFGNSFLKFSSLRQLFANFRQITSLLSDSLITPNCFKVSE